jgi:hypothetical protein
MASDVLFTIAELAVALAGFSGVVVGLRGRAGGLSPQDRFGMVHILSSSGAAMLFSMLPFALHAAGLEEATAWRATTLALGLFVLVASTLWLLAGRRTAPRFPAIFWTFVASGVLLGATMLATASGAIEYSGSLLPLALIWLLFVAFSQFVTFLSVLWAGEA